jgi:glycosyltransferase involved in cell wall biosynthesis
MEIHQLLPGFQYGDAISNHALALQSLLRSWGHTSEIYARYIGPKVAGRCFHLRQFRPFNPQAVIYHYSIGSDEVTNLFVNCPGKRVLIYHNITPHRFFACYDDHEYESTKKGRVVLEELRDVVHLALADSAYNCRELSEKGYVHPRVLPILLDLERFNRTPPCPDVLRRFPDDWKNFLFVGRLAPNKRQDEVIRVFAYYNRFIDSRSRLFLVGGYVEGHDYVAELRRLVWSHKLQDHVVFTGHVPFKELLAFYKLAHVFLCMSEHEGFCVPFIEAFNQGVPIVAYKSTAVPYTLADSGMMVDTKDYAVIAELAAVLLSNSELKRRIVARQRRRLADFEPRAIAERFRKYIDEVMAA